MRDLKHYDIRLKIKNAIISINEYDNYSDDGERYIMSHISEIDIYEKINIHERKVINYLYMFYSKVYKEPYIFRFKINYCTEKFRDLTIKAIKQTMEKIDEEKFHSIESEA